MRQSIRLLVAAIAWLLLSATMLAWAAGQFQPWHFGFGTTRNRAYISFQTTRAHLELLRESEGGAADFMGPYSMSPLDLLKDLHGPDRIENLLGIRLHHGTLTLPPGRFSPFCATRHFSIAALAVPYPQLLTLAALPPIFFTWRYLRSRRRHPRGHCPQCGYNLTANTSGVCPECDHPFRR
jgi:hypothetical protein